MRFIVIALASILCTCAGIRTRDVGKHGRPKFCRALGECFEYTEDASHTLVNNASNDLALPSPDEHLLRLDENFVGDVEHSTLSPTMTSCLFGRLVPMFVVLGAQKSATTNFAARLLKVAVSIVPPKPNDGDPSFFWKELHVFNNKQRYESLGVSGWLNYFPNCPQTHYAIGMDATPSYLPSIEAPKRMSLWYGSFSQNINFLVILRDPLPRMRSSFYHMTDVAKRMKRNVPSSFGRYLSHALSNYAQGCPSGKVYSDAAALKACEDPANLIFTGDPLYLSLYVRQLKNWFADFHPNQFVISGMLSYVAPTEDTPHLVDFMASRLGSSVKKGANTAAFSKKESDAGNVHKYPSFESELATLTKAERDQLDNIMGHEAGPKAMAELLSPAMERGLTLFGYNGAAHDVSAIGEYIARSW